MLTLRSDCMILYYTGPYYMYIYIHIFFLEIIINSAIFHDDLLLSTDGTHRVARTDVIFI